MKSIACLAVLGVLAWQPVDAATPSWEARDCPAAAAAVGARCGVIHVPEDHGRPRGRKIGLNVLVLPATGTPRDPKLAQYDLEGGPGFAATDFLEFYAGDGALYRHDHDIVLADMRGTGQSSPLRCAAIEEYEKRSPNALMYPVELVKECAQQSTVAADPRHYTTPAAARDIELVRRALGYERLDLNAISFGTTLALQYIELFPKRVHSAVMMGTVPAIRTPPRFHAPAAQASLTQLAADCAAQPSCRDQFGDVNDNLRRALEHLKQEGALPVPVFMEKLRNRMYAPFTRAGVPALLARAARGDFQGFTAAAANGRVFADGLYLSITCAESFARMDVPAAIAASAATSFGAYRLERQSEACAHWPVSSKSAAPAPMKNSPVPVLFIAGEQDPVSPAEWAAETAAHFPAGKLVRVANGAHVLDGLSDLDTCLDAVIVKFFALGSARELDTSCFASMKSPPFEGNP